MTRRFGKKSVTALLRQDPLHHVLDLGHVLGIDRLVLFFAAVFELDLWTLGHELDQLGFRFGLALVLRGGLLVGGSLLGFVDRVAFRASALFGQLEGGVGID